MEDRLEPIGRKLPGAVYVIKAWPRVEARAPSESNNNRSPLFDNNATILEPGGGGLPVAVRVYSMLGRAQKIYDFQASIKIQVLELVEIEVREAEKARRCLHRALSKWKSEAIVLDLFDLRWTVYVINTCLKMAVCRVDNRIKMELPLT